MRANADGLSVLPTVRLRKTPSSQSTAPQCWPLSAPRTSAHYWTSELVGPFSVETIKPREEKLGFDQAQAQASALIRGAEPQVRLTLAPSIYFQYLHCDHQLVSHFLLDIPVS